MLNSAQERWPTVVCFCTNTGVGTTVSVQWDLCRTCQKVWVESKFDQLEASRIIKSSHNTCYRTLSTDCKHKLTQTVYHDWLLKQLKKDSLKDFNLNECLLSHDLLPHEVAMTDSLATACSISRIIICVLTFLEESFNKTFNTTDWLFSSPMCEAVYCFIWFLLVL